MSKNATKIDEQEICVSCGFCCDNTLFEQASAESEFELPKKIKDIVFVEEGSERFSFPCPYFEGKCTIYEEHKPTICSTFICKLLRDHEKNRITKEEALTIVARAKTLRKEIIDLWHDKMPDTNNTYREILKFVNNEDVVLDDELNIIKLKTNLLSVLLVRYFRSEASFNEYLTD